jgi:hypothetical protein
MSDKKTLTRDYLKETLEKIQAGDKPHKNPEEISKKEFLKALLPHLRSFRKDGYSPKEIAVFVGGVSASDIKKALEKGEEKAVAPGRMKDSKPKRSAAPARPKSALA